MTLSKKLNGAFLGITVFVLLLMLGLARWSFERGFLEYVNAIETSRLESLSSMLSELYVAQNESWDTMTRSQFNWMLNMSAVMARGDGGDFLPPPRARREPPPPRGARSAADGGPSRFPPRGPGPQGGPPIGGPPPTQLHDMNGNVIVADSLEALDDNAIRVPVMVGKIQVATLLSAPKYHFDSPEETAFSRQQLITSLLAALACLALAGAVAFFVSGRILGPIRQMIANVSRLSKGDYTARLDGKQTDELGQLMTDMDHLAFSLEKNQSARQRWIADISHELRTPMTVLTGELEAIKDGIRPFDHQQLMSIDQEIARLRRLVDDLYQLSLSDIGGLRYRFENLDLSELVQLSADSIVERCKGRGLTLTVSATQAFMVNGDEQRLQQLITNLLENAIAYTDQPGQIQLVLEACGQQVCLSVRDSAPSVQPEVCEQLFEPLYRQDSSRQRRESGAGLGLAICKNIVEAHHGSINATPSAIGGLEVNVKLPLLLN
ncbi:HAMP domain-containing protein [Neiella marina]|uniref:histidine kinase n=1 Tax=Neiella holothuriorum TaxID=2870530 RepID=A0ABS7ECV0_9GAMM|nr:ATP-binding protein [Neiella holothuriorum]MBW8190176.1 HAMP domain-containing protein [Neiella holothuriorum]